MMNEYLINLKLGEMSKAIYAMMRDIEMLKEKAQSDYELWDSSDLVRNWHVSDRTLADWRKKKLIGYVQINKKIYYPFEEREKFLKSNKIVNNEA
jgi:hypothetical protein